MKRFFDFRRLRKTSYDDSGDEVADEYVELNADANFSAGSEANVTVRPFTIEDFSDVKPI